MNADETSDKNETDEIPQCLGYWSSVTMESIVLKNVFLSTFLIIGLLGNSVLLARLFRTENRLTVQSWTFYVAYHITCILHALFSLPKSLRVSNSEVYPIGLYYLYAKSAASTLTIVHFASVMYSIAIVYEGVIFLADPLYSDHLFTKQRLTIIHLTICVMAIISGSPMFLKIASWSHCFRATDNVVEQAVTTNKYMEPHWIEMSYMSCIIIAYLVIPMLIFCMKLYKILSIMYVSDRVSKSLIIPLLCLILSNIFCQTPAGIALQIINRRYQNPSGEQIRTLVTVFSCFQAIHNAILIVPYIWLAKIWKRLQIHIKGTVPRLICETTLMLDKESGFNDRVPFIDNFNTVGRGTLGEISTGKCD